VRKTIAATVSVLLLAALCPFIMGRAWLAVDNPRPPHAAQPGVLRIVMVTTFEGSGVSMLQWVKNQAAAYRKQHKDVLFHIQAVNPAQLAGFFLPDAQSVPDLVIFPPGYMKAEHAQALPPTLTQTGLPAAQKAAGAHAVMLAWQPYAVLLDDAILTAHSAALDPGCGNEGWQTALRSLQTPLSAKSSRANGGLCMGRDGPGGAAVALIESADTPGQWAGALQSGFSVFKGRTEAWHAYRTGRYAVLIGTGRDAMRARARLEQKGTAFTTWPLGARQTYTDMAYYAALPHTADPAALDFLTHLATTAQPELADTGLHAADKLAQSPSGTLLFAPAFADRTLNEMVNDMAIDLLCGVIDAKTYTAARDRLLS